MSQKKQLFENIIKKTFRENKSKEIRSFFKNRFFAKNRRRFFAKDRHRFSVKERNNNKNSSLRRIRFSKSDKQNYN